MCFIICSPVNLSLSNPLYHKNETPQQEDSAVGSLSLFGFQQSIYASVSAFLKRFTSDLRQTLFFEVSKSLKPLKYKAFRNVEATEKLLTFKA